MYNFHNAFVAELTAMTQIRSCEDQAGVSDEE